MTKALLTAVAAALALSVWVGPSLTASPLQTVTSKERLDVLKRAQVWKRTDIPSMDMRRGPADGAFTPGETVTCDYVEKKFSGHTPKFACERDGKGKEKERLKVRYGRDNGEVYAGVAATRLLWALGFGADGLYPVRVVCRGCPEALQAEGEPVHHAIAFEVAAIERSFAGQDVEARGADDGWSWKELDLVDRAAGGATVEQRDALKLLAVMLQHSDNKPEQQRLVCLSGGDSRRELAGCPDPFMMIHDLGVTFGRANLRNRPDIGSVNLEAWSKERIWKDAGRCVGNLGASQTGTLENPVISEGGRLFLANLLAQLTDRQLRDMFSVARFDEKPSGGGPIDAWVAAFKTKRDEITTIRCR